MAERAKISWRFEAPDEVARGPILARVDVALDVDVYFRPERLQRSLGGEKVVYELFIVTSYEITRGLDVHVLCPHQHGHEVVAFQSAVKFHVIGIQVLELDNKRRAQLLDLGRKQNILTFAKQTMSTALKYIF